MSKSEAGHIPVADKIGVGGANKNTALVIFALASFLVGSCWVLVRYHGIVPDPSSVGAIVLGLTVQLLVVIGTTSVLHALIQPVLRSRLMGYNAARNVLKKRVVAVPDVEDKTQKNHQENDTDVWSELREQVLGAIGPEAKFGKLKQLRNELKWFSKKEAKAIFDNPSTGNKVWLRILKLFSDSVSIYERRKDSLLNKNDIRTTYVDSVTYNENLKQLKQLQWLTKSTIKRKAILDALRTAPLLIAVIVIYLVNAVVYRLNFMEFNNWWLPPAFVLSGVGLALFLRSELDYGFRFVTQRLGVAAENLLVDLMTGPILAVVVAFFVYEASQSMPSVFSSEMYLAMSYFWGNELIRILIVVTSAWLSIYLIKDLIVFILDRWAGTLPVKFDETFVGVTQKVAGVYICIIASGILVASFREQLGISTPETILFPYLFAVSLLTGILGYASRDTLENFFAGVMIRMNPPFEKGDRILLETGELCDVREIGMRTVTFYNVQMNVEIYVPNKTAYSMTVTNVSRPDLELRVQVPVKILVKQGGLETAERILIDIAYSEGEVDQMIIDDGEFGEDKIFWNRDRNRYSVRELVSNLRRIYPRIDTTKVATGEIVSTKAGAMHTEEFQKVIERALDGISNAREKYHKASGTDIRIEQIKDIIKHYQDLSNAVYSIGDTLPDIKEELDPLISELSKEPVVSSKFEASSTGSPYLALTLSVFAFHLERRFEVEHKLNRAILDRLDEAKLLV